jgi:hypothetical protein
MGFLLQIIEDNFGIMLMKYKTVSGGIDFDFCELKLSINFLNLAHF